MRDAEGETETTEVQLTVAMKANVEFKDLFGEAEVVAYKPMPLTCVAKNARPAGKFSWRVEVSGREPQYLTNTKAPQHEAKNGVFTTTEVEFFQTRIFVKKGLRCEFVKDMKAAKLETRKRKCSPSACRSNLTNFLI